MSTKTGAASRRYMTVPEVCEELGVTRRTLYDWWSKGRGPRRVKLPNSSVRVRVDWLEDWLLGLEDDAA